MSAIEKKRFDELNAAIERTTTGANIGDAITLLQYFRLMLIARSAETMPDAVAQLDIRNAFDRIQMGKNWDALHRGVMANNPKTGETH